MSLNRNQYWWIELPDGKLCQYGREIGKFSGSISDCGCPNLFKAKYQAQALLRLGEQAVVVELIKKETK